MSFRFAIGQDSHAFETRPEKLFEKPLILGGVVFEGCPCLVANSDGDVMLHALTNAVSGITCRNILGSVADEMLKAGTDDSAEYLKAALADLSFMGGRIVNISFSVEAQRPRFSARIDELRASVAELCGIGPDRVGVTATSGEGLSDFGRGLGIMVFCSVAAEFTEAELPDIDK